MDDFDTRLTNIVTTIEESSLSDTQKADCCVQLSVGLQKLVWPILVSHIPENELKDAVNRPETLTVSRYGELMGMALGDPTTAAQIHTEVMEALTEIESLVSTQIPKPLKP